MNVLGRTLAFLLIVIHGGLLIWALVGFLEFHPEWVFTDISNPLFGRTTLLWQWSIVAVASLAYLLGFGFRMHWLPEIMTVFYGVMAITCAYQTFFILLHDSRFMQMAIEFLEYTLILWILYRNVWFERWLGRKQNTPTGSIETDR